MPCYLLYGEDTFRSKQKLREIKSRFYDANMGDFNISQLEGEDLVLERIKQAVYPSPFLAPKRLIIIKNFLEEGRPEEQEKIARELNSFPAHSIVVFYEDKNINETSALFKKMKREEFRPFSSSGLLKWAKEEIEKRGGKIENSALNRLIQITGSDLWRLSMEIEKLVSYRKDENIWEEDVNFLVKEEIHPKVFELIDTIARKDAKKALLLLKTLLSLGENGNYILSMIAYQFRNLLVIADLKERNKPLSMAGLHPYALQKALSLTDNFTKEQLEKVYEKLLQADSSIKSGFLKPDLALELLISEISHG